MDTRTQNAMRETYMKEMRVRLKWHLLKVQSAKLKAEALAKAKEEEKEPLKLPAISPATLERQAKIDLAEKFAPCAKITKAYKPPCPRVEVPTKVTEAEPVVELKAAKAEIDLALKAVKAEDEVPPKAAKPPVAEVPTLDAEAEAKRMLELAMKPMMNPATPRTKALLYDGIFKLQEGRYRYLKARSNIIPEIKYRYPITTNFDYGWELGKQGTELKKRTIYPRLHLVKDTFYRKNGVFNMIDRHDAAF